jgi:nitroreductase
MTRAFTAETVDPLIIEQCVDLASRAPSAGKSQGWHLLVLEGADTSRYWDVAFPVHQRKSFAFPGLFDAPVIALSLSDPGAYLSRYSEADKEATGLGEGVGAWPAPYWTIDASFATMTFLLALEDAELGALFFAHANEDDLRREFSIPESIEILGTIAIGHPSDIQAQQGRSAARSRRSSADIMHRSRW